METKTSKMEVRKEVRFAVVMYGGVSLAIYIPGQQAVRPRHRRSRCP